MNTVSVSWAANTMNTTVGACYLTAAGNLGGTEYSSSVIPCTFTVPSTFPTDNGGTGNCWLVCVGSANYVWYANGNPMSDGGEVGTSGQHRWFIALNLAANPTAEIYCQPD